jgi:putative heme-binding domain-containing protein
LLDDPALCTTALRFLPTFGDAGTPEKIFGKYSAFGDDARREAIATLTSRADWAKLLLDKAEKGGIPKRDFTAYHWQQLVLLKDPSIAARVEKLFGQVRPTKDDRTALIAEWKQKLSDEALTKADVAHGRAVFNKTCAACHKLFDAGGQIGPELTGAQRNNLDYVLSNVLDPSAVVPRDYQMQIIVTNDGRTLLGIVKSESDAVVTLQTATALLKIAKSDIEERTATNQSMMPEGLIQQFSLTDFRDLVAYLRSPQQVPNEKAD